MKREIHIWDLPKEYIYIQLKEGFREEFFNSAHDFFGSWNKLGCFLGVRRGDTTIPLNWKSGSVCFPLQVALKIGERLGLAPEIIEQNIIQIRYKRKLDGRGGSSGKSIYYPKLPIQINKDFLEILGHICGDGSIPIKYSEKGIPTLYINSQPELIDRFKCLISRVFGKIDARVDVRVGEQYSRPNYVLAYPTIVSLFILSVFDYRVKEDMNLPFFLGELSTEEKAMFLRAIFDDEATVSVDRKCISFVLKPRKPIEGVRSLLIDLGIKPSRIYKIRDIHRFQIGQQKNVRAFHERVGFHHPLKKEKLDAIIEMGWKFQTHPTMQVQAEIIKCLDSSPLTTIKVREKLEISSYTALQNLHALELRGKITGRRVIVRNRSQNVNIIFLEWRRA